MNKKELFLLITALILLAVFTYSPHFSYKLPYHLDEWDHIGRSIRIQEQGFSYFINNTPIEVGFDLILLIITKFTSLFNLDIVNIYQFLPAINILIISLILFFNLKKEYNYALALLSFLFIIFLPSNVNILGIWFYVPILAAIPLVYLILFQIEKEKYERKDIWIIALSLLFIAFIHQSSFLLISLILLIYFSFNKHKIHWDLRKAPPFILILIPIILTILFLTNNLSDISNLFKSMIWGPIKPQINYNIFSLYGFLASIFSFIGFYISAKDKKLLTFRIYYTISLISILIFPLIEKSFFSAYQRYLYHFMFAAIPLSAIGIYYSFKLLNNKISNANKIFKYALIILFISFITISTIYQHSEFKSKTKLYTVLESDEINILKELSKYPKGIILAPIDMGIAVKPITKIHEPALTFFDWEKTENLSYFYNADCEKKEEMIYNENLLPDISEHNFNSKYNRHNIDYIISEKRINCEFLKLLRKSENYYIYETELNIETLLKINKFRENQEKIIIPSGKIYDNFTLYAWVKPKLPTSGIIKSVYGDGYNTSWMVYTDKEYIRINWGDSKDKFYLISKEKIKQNSTLFIAVTYNGNFTLYLDGKLQDTKLAKFEYEKINLGLAKTRVGAIFDKPAPYEINDLNIINKVLIEKKLKEIFNNQIS